MSGSGQNHPTSAGQGNLPSGVGNDPSMEDILASIRRILSEDDGSASRKTVPVTPMVPEPPAPNGAPPSPVFALDESMLVREPLSVPVHSTSSLAALGSFMTAAVQAEPIAAEPAPEIVRAPVTEPAPKLEVETTPVAVVTPEPSEQSATLVAPEAAAAAAASMGTLLRTLSAERHTAVYRGGPTLEDLVRDEMRPMLKEWLDANVPSMVERIVRSEIERMAGRVAF
jgi:cell pole-organizing protein PopZ